MPLSSSPPSSVQNGSTTKMAHFRDDSGCMSRSSSIQDLHELQQQLDLIMV